MVIGPAVKNVSPCWEVRVIKVIVLSGSRDGRRENAVTGLICPREYSEWRMVQIRKRKNGMGLNRIEGQRWEVRKKKA
jgi:hypothetical protein